MVLAFGSYVGLLFPSPAAKNGRLLYRSIMRIVSLNVRGFNSGAKRDSVTELVNSHRPTILALQETKLSHATPSRPRARGQQTNGNSTAPSLMVRAAGFYCSGVYLKYPFLTSSSFRDQ